MIMIYTCLGMIDLFSYSHLVAYTENVKVFRIPDWDLLTKNRIFLFNEHETKLDMKLSNRIYKKIKMADKLQNIVVSSRLELDVD